MHDYEANETARLVGFQTIQPILHREHERLYSSLTASYKPGTFADDEKECIAIDFFLLGIIAGKREERKRKASRQTVKS